MAFVSVSTGFVPIYDLHNSVHSWIKLTIITARLIYRGLSVVVRIHCNSSQLHLIIIATLNLLYTAIVVKEHYTSVSMILSVCCLKALLTEYSSNKVFTVVTLLWIATSTMCPALAFRWNFNTVRCIVSLLNSGILIHLIQSATWTIFLVKSRYICVYNSSLVLSYNDLILSPYSTT